MIVVVVAVAAAVSVIAMHLLALRHTRGNTNSTRMASANRVSCQFEHQKRMGWGRRVKRWEGGRQAVTDGRTHRGREKKRDGRSE